MVQPPSLLKYQEGTLGLLGTLRYLQPPSLSERSLSRPLSSSHLLPASLPSLPPSLIASLLSALFWSFSPSPPHTSLSHRPTHRPTHPRRTYALSLRRAINCSFSLAPRSLSRSLSSFFYVCVSLVLTSLPAHTRSPLASQCGTCELPQVCLAYTEYLKHGSVILDGQDVCSFTSFVWTDNALQTLMDATNIRTSDLACERNKHTCHHAEDLKQNNCTSKVLKTVPGYCRASVFSEFGRGTAVIEQDACWNGHEYHWKDIHSLGAASPCVRNRDACVHTYTKSQTPSTRRRGPGWRIHGSVEDTKLSTNKQHCVRKRGGRGSSDYQGVFFFFCYFFLCYEVFSQTLFLRGSPSKLHLQHKRERSRCKDWLLLRRLCSQMHAPMQSLHWPLNRLFSQMHAPPQSLHWLLTRLCSQMEVPPGRRWRCPRGRLPGGTSICAHRRVRSQCKDYKRHKAELAAADSQAAAIGCSACESSQHPTTFHTQHPLSAPCAGRAADARPGEEPMQGLQSTNG